jgi:hypothetical protein
MRDYELQAARTYKHLLNECPSRNNKIVIESYPDAVAFIEEIEIFLCRMALVLGDIKPNSDADESIRDLFAEAFDSLLLAKNAIYEGYVGKAFPLMRQGYELMELMGYFYFNPGKEFAWRGKDGKAGKSIEPKEIRNFYEKNPQYGDLTFKQELYNSFSSASHTNRLHIPYRQLGITNQFTLGNFGHPGPKAIEQLMRLVELYSYLRHYVFTIYGTQMTAVDKELQKALEAVTDERATKIRAQLKQKFIDQIPTMKTK